MGLTDTLPAVLSNIWLYGILFLGVVTFVIFIHEMGHYVVARLFGVRPELVSLGFGRELIGRTDRHGTRWSLRLYPFGGYVRMFGQQETPEMMALPPAAAKQAYCRRHPLVRAGIATGGPLANFIFGVTLLACVYMGIGRVAPEPYISALDVGGPADRAGLKIGDLFYAFDGKKLHSTEQAKRELKNKVGVPVRVEVKRGNDFVTVTLIPKRLEEKNAYGHKTERGTLGAIYPNYGLEIREIHKVAGQDTKGNPDLARKLLLDHVGQQVVINFGRENPTDFLINMRGDLNRALTDPAHKDFNSLTLGKRPRDTIRQAGFVPAWSEAVALSGQAAHATLGSIYQIAVGTKKTSELGGVIKISAMTADMAKQGTIIFCTFVALLSVNIGLVNLMPVPMLDGGQIMFCLAEAIRGRPISLTTKAYTYGFGLIFLILTIFIVNMNDVIALLKAG